MKMDGRGPWVCYDDYAQRNEVQKYEITYVTSAGAPGRIGLYEAQEIFKKEFGITLTGVEIFEGPFIHNGTGNGHETIVLRVTRWEEEK